MNTSFACKVDFEYVYDLCALSSLYVQIIILRVKRFIAYVYDLCARSGLCVRIRLCEKIGIFCTYTTCALEAAYAYEYVFTRKLAFLQCLGDLLTWR